MTVNGTELPTTDNPMETDLRTDMGLSSIGMLYFVIVIESVFPVRFESVGVEDFITLGDVVRYIQEHATI